MNDNNSQDSQSLLEHSLSYTKNANVYDQFSQSEDKLGLIAKELIKLTDKKDVLDVGCGSGKYTSIIQSTAKSITGVDQSLEQIALAKSRCMGAHSKLFTANATSLPFDNASFDVVLSSWVVGTIESSIRQTIALNEMKRVCRQSGSIVLVENDISSEFEFLRGRGYPDTRTQDYNNFLLNQGFRIHSKIDTYFEFDSSSMAQNVFSSIWGQRLTRPITSSRVEHKVIIFVYDGN